MKPTIPLLSLLAAATVNSETDAIQKNNNELGLFWERELQNSAPPITDSPTRAPIALSGTPGPTPFIDPRCSLTPVSRRSQILTILRTVSNAAILSTNGTPQDRAAEWLIGADDFYVCPGDEKLIQRYVMALFYYSTAGETWNLCSQGDVSCTASGNTPYLTPVHECEWFGSACDAELCMTEIIFEANNVGGSIPFELEQLTGLEVLSLEQGSLQQSIPSNLGTLQSLRILDLDFNQITGPIPVEIYGVTTLQQLDLNSNRLTGSIPDAAGNLLVLQLFQLYENLLTGTIPDAMGNLESLVIAEFYNNTFTGTMPQSVCDNRAPNGALTGLTSDCFPNPLPQIECSCCTGCAVW